MDRHPVSSSSIVSVGYDPTSETLEVEFSQSGKVYEYYNVQPFMYERMLEAPSIGVFFNAEIRNSYGCSQI